MTAFTRKTFTVPAPGTDAYRDGYERTFGKKDAPADAAAPTVEVVTGGTQCAGFAPKPKQADELIVPVADSVGIVREALKLTMDLAETVLKPGLPKDELPKEFKALIGDLTLALEELRELERQYA